MRPPRPDLPPTILIVYSENHPKRLQMLRRAAARAHFPHPTGSAAEQRRAAGIPQDRIDAIAADANWRWPCRRLHEHGPQDRHRNPQNSAGPASAKIPAVPFAKAQRPGSKRSRIAAWRRLTFFRDRGKRRLVQPFNFVHSSGVYFGASLKFLPFRPSFKVTS